LTLVVDDDEIVWDVQHEIALILGSGSTQSDRLELERQIVAEGSVQAEVCVLRRREGADHGTEHREHARLTAPLLFWKAPIRALDAAVDFIGPGVEIAYGVEFTERFFECGNQDPAALVQRFDAEFLGAGRQAQGRVLKAQIPTGVASGVVVARGQEHPTAAVEAVDQCFHGRGAINHLASAPHLKTAFGGVF
jgi:hypothetical protein